MTPQISAEAAAILDKPENSYWRPREGDKELIRVDAIEFAQAYFLAGPFDEKFGLVYIHHKPDAAPLQVQKDIQRASIMDACSTSYMPYSARTKLDTRYSGTVFYWDPVGREGYSDLDLPHLADDVRERLTDSDSRCQVFAKTEQGKAELLAHLTEEEQAAYVAAKQKAADECEEDLVRTGLYAERPYKVRLQGNDDASWSANLANEQEVDELIASLRERGEYGVYNLMTFTN